MNAQEAIGITEEKLRRLNVIFTEMNYDLMTIKEEKRIQYWKERIDKIKKEIEALKIVLESAKLFHKNIKKFESTVGENLAKEVFINLYDDYMIITKNQATAIGIEAE